MKATGIVRRIDELGRVVIPKELRRTLGIKIGDPLEIFAEDSGEITLRKFAYEGKAAEAAKLVYNLTENMPPDLGKRIRAMVEPVIETLTKEIR